MITGLLMVFGALLLVGVGFLVVNSVRRPRQNQASASKVEKQMLVGEKQPRGTGID